MRIAIMCSSPGGGGLSPNPVELALSFKRQGHDVHAFCGSKIEYETGLRARMEAAGIIVHEIPFAESTGLRGMSPFDSSLRKEMLAISPDVVHCWGPRFAYQSRPFGRRRQPHRPVYVAMIMAMGHDGAGWRGKVGAWMANNYLDRALGCCSIDLQRLRTLGIRSEKLDLMLAPISCAPALAIEKQALADGREAVLKEFNLPAHRKLLGYIAKFRAVKRQDLLIRAFTKLAPEFPDWDLVLPGEGEGLEECKASANAIPGRVHFLGNIQHERALRLTAAVDAIAHTSDIETFGWSMLESLLLGKPVVFTRAGVAGEVQQAKTGLVTDIGNLDQLIASLRTLLTGGPEIDAMAAGGPTWVQENFDVDVVAKKLVAVYERLRGATPSPVLGRGQG